MRKETQVLNKTGNNNNDEKKINNVCYMGTSVCSGNGKVSFYHFFFVVCIFLFSENNNSTK